jgi:phosphoribosyl-AMP cyclohydrolase
VAAPKLSTESPDDAAKPSAAPDFAAGGGLLPAIAQDAATGEVLMIAYMNAEAFAETVASGRAVYFSRSRNRLWRKGEESGNFQIVESIFVDCDGDAILLKVRQIGDAACHTGHRSCFYRQVTPDGLREVSAPLFDPAVVYSSKSPQPSKPSS